MDGKSPRWKFPVCIMDGNLSNAEIARLSCGTKLAGSPEKLDGKYHRRKLPEKL